VGAENYATKRRSWIAPPARFAPTGRPEAERIAKAKTDWLTAHLEWERIGTSYDSLGLLGLNVDLLPTTLPRLLLRATGRGQRGRLLRTPCLPKAHVIWI
jgi:hypothetical protein